ncbi:peroxiredoxin-6-like [Amphibalanus amphitrite]|uniref:peroxiredoxin-6-like n=1 Tax=Amphibalanus amphitrite TaxID=1232801 RepID=UPI001C90FB3C|nr:peroxiredoxin-6-like [Amphibalanus amphitrite]
MVVLGEVFPNFEAESTEGHIRFHDFIRGSWCILLAHPSDFTPVCTTEMGAAAKMAPALLRRGVKMACISCDPVSSHKTWIEDIRAYNGLGSGPFPFPIISDEERQLAKKLGMIDPDEPRFDNKPATARAVFIIGPDLRLKLSMLYPGTTGRNFAEIQRIMESLLVTAKHKVVTPEQWQVGEKCFVVPFLSMEEAKDMFPAGVQVHPVPSGKQYLRTTPMPN